MDEIIFQDDLIPGIPNEIALICLARLPTRARSRCRCVSRTFRRALSNEDLMERICEEQRIASTHRLVFVCLGIKHEPSLTDEEEDDEYAVEDDWGMMYTGLVWLIIDPIGSRYQILEHLEDFGPDAVCRSIRLAAGHHPGQVLIHGLVRNSDHWSGCPWKHESQIWCFNVFSRKMFSCNNTRVCRTDFAWARFEDKLYIISGKSYPEDGNVFLYDAESYNVTAYANDFYQQTQSHRNAENDNVDEYNNPDSYVRNDDAYDDEMNDASDDNYADFECWSPISDINEPRRLCAAFTCESGLYLLGGVSEDGEPITSGECYDPEFDTWDYIPGMWPYDDFGRPSIAVVNNQIYAVKPMTTEIIRNNGWSAHWMDFANLPNSCSAYAQYQLLGVGDELWILFQGTNGKFSVLSCRPSFGENTVSWKRSFTDLAISPDLHILDSVVIEGVVAGYLAEYTKCLLFMQIFWRFC